MVVESRPARPAFFNFTIMFERTSIIELPRGLLNARDLAFVGKLSEADTAKVEIAHVTAAAAALEATMSSPSAELRGFPRACDD
jgi:hypothetical protein